MPQANELEVGVCKVTGDGELDYSGGEARGEVNINMW